MASAIQIKNIWRLGRYIPPFRVFASDGLTLYVVIDDRDGILLLYDEYGVEYQVARNRCRVNETTYICPIPTPVSQRTTITPESFSDRHNYARHQILPLVYYGGDLGF